MEEIDQDNEEYKKFLKYVGKKEKQGKDWSATLDLQMDLVNFKKKYNVEKNSHLSCPMCQGSLYINESNPNLYTCRSCTLTWELTCRDAEELKSRQELRILEKQVRRAELKEPIPTLEDLVEED